MHLLWAFHVHSGKITLVQMPVLGKLVTASTFVLFLCAALVEDPLDIGVGFPHVHLSHWKCLW